MRDTTTKIVYNSLGSLLKQICESHVVQNSPEIAEKAKNAIAFYQELKNEVSALIEENRSLKQQPTIGLATVAGCVEEPADSFRKYEQMKFTGATAQQVARQLRRDKLDRVNTIKILRRVFDLSLDEAAEILQTNGKTKIAA